MHRLIGSYDLIELQRLRTELTARGIDVHLSDEFTYAIPGLPGAEQPRALWVTRPEDVTPARRIAADLFGEERLDPLPADADDAHGTDPSPADGGPARGDADGYDARHNALIWGIMAAAALIVGWAAS